MVKNTFPCWRCLGIFGIVSAFHRAMMQRRTFIRTSASTVIACALSRSHAEGPVSVELAFDPEIEAFMKARDIPGGALAVVKDRRLVYSRGYGVADREQNSAVTPDSLFRIASISKSFTAVAVLQMVEAGQLKLDARVYELLGIDLSKAADPRLAEITIDQLLHHTGGWDRDKSFDPMFRAREISQGFGEPPPAGPDAVIRYMLGHKLDAAPGSAYSYSNFGYCLLGRVIEKITGERYEPYIQEKMLAPIGIRKMRIGCSLRAGQAPGEVCYYSKKEEGRGENVFGDKGEQVPWPYGGFHLEAMDAHGGWIASVIDLAHFAAALDEVEHSPLLRRATFDQLYAPPAPPVSREADGTKLKERFYACGWSVRPAGTSGRATYWHDGSLPGTATLLVRRHDGLSWAVCFNQRSEDKKLPDRAIDAGLHRAADRVTVWPEGTALLAS
jgi:N-acyl-D-amino-acid deacylase